jgi:GT2 family glycosyltransferase
VSPAGDGSPVVDVAIPTYRRPGALAVTLTALAASSVSFRLVVSDQTEDYDSLATGEVAAVLRYLAARHIEIETHRHLPRRGLAEHRQFLLDRVRAPYVVFLDDDVLTDGDLLERLLAAIVVQRCGFVGSAVIGLSFADDVRPHEEVVEWWDGPVRPERVDPGTAQWNRHVLHSAANLWHLQRRLELTPSRSRLYKVAWVGGCVLYDAVKLRDSGGFSFWRDLPVEHCGEDVLAQLRVMERYGGCGLAPSGAYHQELPTTVVHREFDAPRLLR